MDVKKLKIHVVTWNVGNAQPAEDEIPFLFQGSSDITENDMIVVGVQECAYKIDTKHDKTKAQIKEKFTQKRNELEKKISKLQYASMKFSKSRKDLAADVSKALQDELVDEHMDEESSTRRKHFERLLISFIGEEFHPLKTVSLVEMKLVVFLHRRHRFEVETCASFSVGTGLGNIYGNKGGLVVYLQIYNTRLAFVSCHLAAHMPNLDKRNEDIFHILSASSHHLRVDSRIPKEITVPEKVDHCFWLGDLNYRVDFDRRNGSKPSDFNENFQRVLKLVKSKQYEQIMSADQLKLEQHKGAVLEGFREGKYAFAPTFKVQKGLPDSLYNKKRIPSYCDRILWHSLPGKKQEIRQLALFSPQIVSTSDHKPVCSSFNVNMSPAVILKENSDLDCLRIKIGNLCVTRVPENRSGIPRKIFYEVATFPSGLFDNRGSSSTKSRAIDYSKDSHTFSFPEVLEFRTKCASATELGGCYLYILLKQHAVGAPCATSKVIGNTILSLSTFQSVSSKQRSSVFNRKLLHQLSVVRSSNAFGRIRSIPATISGQIIIFSPRNPKIDIAVDKSFFPGLDSDEDFDESMLADCQEHTFVSKSPLGLIVGPSGRIKRVEKYSEAHLVSIMPGDRIVGINNLSVFDWTRSPQFDIADYIFSERKNHGRVMLKFYQRESFERATRSSWGVPLTSVRDLDSLLIEGADVELGTKDSCMACFDSIIKSVVPKQNQQGPSVDVKLSKTMSFTLTKKVSFRRQGHYDRGEIIVLAWRSLVKIMAKVSDLEFLLEIISDPKWKLAVGETLNFKDFSLSKFEPRNLWEDITFLIARTASLLSESKQRNQARILRRLIVPTADILGRALGAAAFLVSPGQNDVGAFVLSQAGSFDLKGSEERVFAHFSPSSLFTIARNTSSSKLRCLALKIIADKCACSADRPASCIVFRNKEGNLLKQSVHGLSSMIGSKKKRYFILTYQYLYEFYGEDTPSHCKSRLWLCNCKVRKKGKLSFDVLSKDTKEVHYCALQGDDEDNTASWAEAIQTACNSIKNFSCMEGRARASFHFRNGVVSRLDPRRTVGAGSRVRRAVSVGTMSLLKSHQSLSPTGSSKNEDSPGALSTLHMNMDPDDHIDVPKLFLDQDYITFLKDVVYSKKKGGYQHCAAGHAGRIMSLLTLLVPSQSMEKAQRYYLSFLATKGLHAYIKENMATDLYGLEEFLKLSKKDHLFACENIVYSRSTVLGMDVEKSVGMKLSKMAQAFGKIKVFTNDSRMRTSSILELYDAILDLGPQPSFGVAQEVKSQVTIQGHSRGAFKAKLFALGAIGKKQLKNSLTFKRKQKKKKPEGPLTRTASEPMNLRRRSSLGSILYNATLDDDHLDDLDKKITGLFAD